MKKGLRIGLVWALIALTVLLLILIGRGTDSVHAMKTCTGLDVEILDSLDLGFVTRADVKEIMDSDYGVYIGKRLDSLNLKKIENLMTGRSAILACEAFTTEDGLLHLHITQRGPIVRFQAPDGGYYADETGYIFPLHPKYDSQVTLIQGDIPLVIPQGFKGEPATDGEKAWLEGIIGFVKTLNRDKKWNGAFSRIVCEKDGLVLYPAKGGERFIFGGPDDFEAKLEKIEKYYTNIAPSREEGYYKTVNLKYENQIICRRK